MVLLILFIISYGALLILLLPATIPGLVCVVAAFVLGSGLIICKKLFRNISWKLCPFFLILATVFIVVNLGCDFFHRWLSHFELYAIGSMFHIPIRTVVLIGSFVLSVAASYFIYSFLWAIKFFGERASKYRLAVSILFILTSAVLTVVSAQKKLGISNLFSMGFLNLIFGVLIVSIVILFLFCLTGRPIASIIMGSGLFMLISTINVYVYMFRHRLFEPVDIFSAGTAMNVIGNYSLFPVPFTIIDELEIFIITLILFYCFLQKGKFHLASKQRISLLSFCTVACLATAIYLANLKPYHWDILGLEYNGYILDFVLKIKEITVSKPDNYSPEEISELSKLYSLNENNVDERGREQPHIIVIMDEAFSDLSVNGDFSTNIYPMPFISSLKENTVSGYALSSVYGGNTANSEYEFLTGNTMAFLLPSSVPYQQYIRSSTYSMISYLKTGYAYKCIAMHPYSSSGWNRPVVYSCLGFDECYFIDDFQPIAPDKDEIRDYVSDRKMFEFLIETYEAQKDQPLFIFGVTMQNHGDYLYSGDNFTQTISLNDYDTFPDVEQYLSLIYETDKAVEYLINYFENVDEDVVICFFGDHQPSLDDSFYEAIGTASDNTMDEMQKRYKVPFFIWANYDIEEEHIDCTSLNYLSSYLYDVAGINQAPYNKFLSEIETAIPSINTYGFYSLISGCYLPFDKANKEESRRLNLYELMQYNNIFDNKNRNKTLFPVLK